MNKRMLLRSFLVILLSASFAIALIMLFREHTALKKAHYHAGFQVYVDGKLQDLSDIKYMKITPCALNESKMKLTPEEEQLDKAHLHDNVGNVSHSHLKPAYWRDLFTNMKYNFPENKQIKSFINGREVRNIFSTQIKPYDSVIILVGDYDNIDNILKKAVTKEEIVKAEKKSENCGS
jgi:hypothetical protein